MKILHTSDWHIGKKTENFDRLPEQKEVLDEICDIVKREAVDLVILAGDVFDTFVPSAEAEKLFFEKAAHIASICPIVIIPGNHDDATRLCSSSPLASNFGIFFSENVNANLNILTAEVPFIEEQYAFTDEKGRSDFLRVKVKESGEGYVVFEKKGDTPVYVGMLAYPTEARFKERAMGESYVDRLVGWLNKAMGSNVNGYPSVLVSHLFTLGGQTTDGEREISLGGAKAVNVNSFPNASYVALGHLHKRQVVSKDKNVIYSGSILQYSFDEINVEKSVTVFDLNENGVENLKTVPLIKGKKLAKITANSVENCSSLLPAYADYLVELTLKLKSPLTREENAFIRTNFPQVISVKLEIEGTDSYLKKGRKELSDEQLFAECYKKKYGEYPPKDLTDLYLSLMAEVEEE